ncbi:hypothetical protein FNV43_RR19371 [Rhamnella rubrinervis]|uniref:NmrA-like domain-containing protein n=1 Tax=Rhamnella rubrinervis TaxID=2594499 RepID=A0A8K0GY86_9ROSA|nr:hypothetical protein FNV43_RR19371 [Rhamnella rubrinervis]
MAEKRKVLIIGRTGYIGKFIVEASAQAGHPTFALVRESTIYNPEKSKFIQSFKTSGLNLLHGDINDHESLMRAIKVHAVEPAASIFRVKASIRRAIEAEEFPYTFVSSFFFSGYFCLTWGTPMPLFLQETK